MLDTPIDWSNGTFGPCTQPGDPGCGVLATVNFSPDSEEFLLSKESESHGSNVSGIILAMAPAAKVLRLNVFRWDSSQDSVVSYEGDELSALQWVVDNAATYNIVAANMSLGDSVAHSQPCNGDVLFDPIRTLYRDHGVVTVIASGNEARPNATASPACISLAVTVGAQLDTDIADWCGTGQQGVGQIACFSNRSGMVDMTAPGVMVTAGGQTNLSGTSMAAPHVAGAIALLASHLGAPATPVSAHDLSTLLRTYSVPQPFNDQRFDRLRLDQNLAFNTRADFAYFYRDSSENAFSSGPAAYKNSIDVTGVTGTLSGVYLNLELTHSTPENVRVKLTNPDGVSVELALPAGLSHYNGTLGRTHHAGDLAPLAGGTGNGTWSLEISDITGASKGHYLRSSLFLTTECTPQCGALTCGDDSCGGFCDHCVVYDTCFAEGNRDPNNSCGLCKASFSTSSFFGDSGTACDDNNLCTTNDVCSDGVCGGDPTPCPEIECQELITCSASSGQCLYKNLPLGTPCSQGSCYVGECKPIVNNVGGSAGNAGSTTGGSGGDTGAGATGGTSSSGADPASLNDVSPGGGCSCRIGDSMSTSTTRSLPWWFAVALAAARRKRSRKG
ncbi:MAG: S8 family serine peptidase [Polyangiaceae bacterium]